MAERVWTKAQRAGITTTGGSLLLSAAAGSGKTSVLAERCAYLVCDAEPRVAVDSLLVVTYTEAAAAEMRNRIQRSLRGRLAQSPSPWLQRQLALLDHAPISTLHSFCARLLRQNFHLLGLDPGFSIIDPDEAKLLRRQIARRLFDENYNSEDAGIFHGFVDAYGTDDGGDDDLAAKVVAASEMLRSVVDPVGWQADALAQIREAAEKPLHESRLGQAHINAVERLLGTLIDHARVAAARLAGNDAFKSYHKHAVAMAGMLEEFAACLRRDGFDALVERYGTDKIPDKPRINNSIPGKPAASALMDAFRDPLKKELAELLLLDSAALRAGMGQTLSAAGKFLELVDAFDRRYLDAKKAMGVLDFSDLERHALRLLRAESQTELLPSDVARECHRRFEHVLVDEYQDVNEVQDAILHLASRECLRGMPPSNLFCVGDIKQSIYRFRLADPRRFIERMGRLRRNPAAGRVIDLQENFRSRGPLLEAVNAVFERLMTAEAAEIDYDESQRLNARAEFGEPPADAFQGAPIELHVIHAAKRGGKDAPPADADEAEENDEESALVQFEQAEREAALVARRIQSLMGQTGTPRRQVAQRDGDQILYRPVAYSDIVILLRTLVHKAEQYANILRQAGIPVHCDSVSGFFESNEVRDVLSLLSLLDNSLQSIPLAAVLRSPLAALPEPETSLARIRLAYREGEPPVPFYEAAARYAREQRDELAARLREFFQQIERWRELVQRRPLAGALWTIYSESGYLAYCSGLADGEQRAANLIELHRRARQFGRFGSQGLYRFLRFLQTLEAEADLGQPPVGAAHDAVRIMSIHRAKGLEFPVVIIPDLGKRINFEDCSGTILVDRTTCLGLQAADLEKFIRYPTLAWTTARQSLRRATVAEELRVLYVAMTRAKEHLILVGTAKAERAAAWEARWKEHPGSLPADVVRRTGNMLDWLGPVAAATGAGKHFELVCYEPEAVESFLPPGSRRAEISARQKMLAALSPLTPPPAQDALAASIIADLTRPYPYAPAAAIPAAQSVTALAQDVDIPVAQPPSAVYQSSPASTLPLPRIMVEKKITAIDRGIATHLVLQYLDFHRAGDEAELAEQINDLVSRKLITAAEARAVDVDAVLWLAGSPVGELLRLHHGKVHRELPFNYAADPTGWQPVSDLDRVMIRGRLDAMVETAQGLILVDYKTDRVTADQVPARAETYRPQMDFYRQALRDITGRDVAAMHLVFLSPRIIWTR